jgi:hypothetical protein
LGKPSRSNYAGGAPRLSDHHNRASGRVDMSIGEAGELLRRSTSTSAVNPRQQRRFRSDLGARGNHRHQCSRGG